MRLDVSRVAVVGTTGAGKTTFARRLAAAAGSTHIELDAIHWQPHWTPRPKEDFQYHVQHATEGDRWVTDGNYSDVQPIILSRATAIVWLNFSFPRILWRLVWRTVRRVVTRELLYSGNQESLRTAVLSRDSVLWWMLTTFHQRRRRYRVMFADPRWSRLGRVELRRPSDADAFIAAVRRSERPDRGVTSQH